MMNIDPASLQQVIDRLQELAALPDSAISSAAKQWQSSLQEKRDFLANVNYPVVFIGKPGIGKSSVINVAAKLLIGDTLPTDKASLKNAAALAVGAGRSTVCEVQIQAATGQQYALEIEPFDLAQMEQEIDLYARDQWQRQRNGTRRSINDDLDPSAQEWQRLIRSMTGYAETFQSYIDGTVRKKRLIKPLDAAIGRFDSEDAFSEHMITCANLEQRTQTQWTWPTDGIADGTSAQQCLRQLKQQFEAINLGTDATAMLPEKIIVSIPDPFPSSQFGWRIIDTRGLDGAIEGRADLYDWLRNPRAILVFCSEFKDAPEAVIRSLLRNMADNVLLQEAPKRSILLLLDHGDAGQVIGAENDREMGQFLKLDECQQVLVGNHIELPKEQMLALDVLQDDSSRLFAAIELNVQHQRTVMNDELFAQFSDASQFISDMGDVEVARLQRAFDDELKAVMAQNLLNGAPLADPLEGLYAAIAPIHPASIMYASCRRRGSYANFDVYAAVKESAERACGRWLFNLVGPVQEKIVQTRGDAKYSALKNHLNLRLVQVAKGHHQIVAHYAQAVSDEVWQQLQPDPVWQLCCDEWGQGTGFKSQVLGHLKAWSAKQVRLTAHLQTEVNSHIPMLNEVTRPAQAPRFALHVRNLRTLREVVWSPQPVSILIGANGAGKTTLLMILKLLQVAYERDLPEAVNQVLGGINNMRSWGISDDDAIEIGLDMGPGCWRLTLSPNGPTVNDVAKEVLTVGDKEIFSRDQLGQFRYNGKLVEASPLLGLRALMDRGAPESAIRQLASFMQRITVYYDLDVRQLRTQGSNTTQDRHLHPQGINALAILRRWHQDRQERHRFQYVLDGLIAAFPNTVAAMDFDEAGSTVVARIYKPGVELPGPLRHEANGVIQLMVLLCAIASAENESIVAIDEPENCLHPYAIMAFLRRARLWARQHKLTILLTTHSTVLLDEMSAEPEAVFVMKCAENSHVLPTALTQLCDQDWLAGFKLGDLYEQGEIGSNEDDA